MELWFWYAIISALFTGLYTFIQKVAVERGHSSVLIGMWSATVSSILAFFVSYIFFGFDGAWKIGLFLGFINGLTHMIGSLFRMDALKYIDTTILFPLYKTAGPIFTLIIGIIVFAENFSSTEWIGIVLGITVPLFLLHKNEKMRQKNLGKGIFFLLVSAFFIAISAGVGKYSVSIFETIFLFVGVARMFEAFFGLGAYEIQKKQFKNEKKDFKHKHADFDMLFLSLLAGIMQFAGFSALMFAFIDGSLAVVYIINSLYILIPITLSIIIYKEHWNLQKIIAIFLSILTLIFLK